jgi:uncharacterized membrane protein
MMLFLLFQQIMFLYPLCPFCLVRHLSILMVRRLFMASADIHGAKLLPDVVVWPQG